MSIQLTPEQEQRIQTVVDAGAHRSYFIQGRRGRVRLIEKGGKEHEAPCHYKIETDRHEHTPPPALPDTKGGPLFRTTGRATGEPHHMTQSYRVIQRHARAERVSLDEQERVGI